MVTKTEFSQKSDSYDSERTQRSINADSSSTSASGDSKRTKTNSWYNQPFNYDWLQDLDLKDWIESDPNDRYIVHCKLYNLPLEILDIILQKSYLHWLLYSPTMQRDEEIIRSLISVDVCFYRRITRRRFRKAIWRYLKAFYEKTRKRFAIIRNNRNYLMENIKLSNELISSLLSLNCITLEESHLIRRQRSDRDKINELLKVMRSFNGKKFSNCMKCLRLTNQITAARIIENGGGVFKIQVHSCCEKYTESMGTLQQFHQNIEDHRNRTKPSSHQMNRFISHLRDKGIEILNSQLDRQTVVVWIWCRSQAALEYLQRLYESNQLRDELSEVIQPFTFNIIDINRNQFKKTIVVCAISANFIQRIEIPRNDGEVVTGVTELQNEIYVLCASFPSVILIFEDRNAFRLRKEIEMEEIKDPWHIGSSEKNNCLYVSDPKRKCVWNIARETANDEYKIIKWIITDYEPLTLSVSSDGQLLMVERSSSILWIYGSDAELIRSIQLPKDFKEPHHAVKTSIGNFVISHYGWMTVERKNEKLWSRSSGREEIMDKMEDQKDKEEVNEVGKNKEVYEIHDEENEGVEGTEKVDEKKMKKEEEKESESSSSDGLVPISVLSELTSDGQMVVRRFRNETQDLHVPLSLDSDDQVFVADFSNDRVILLDSDLKWNRILISAEDGDGEILRYPPRLCYNDENKQLFVAGIYAINVYSIIRI